MASCRLSGSTHPRHRLLTVVIGSLVAIPLTASARGHGGGHHGGGHFHGGHHAPYRACYGGYAGARAHFYAGHYAHYQGGGYAHFRGGYHGYHGYYRSPRFYGRAWYGGRWYHGWYGGRPGWWWLVGGTWFLYPDVVYPYPDPDAVPLAAFPAPASVNGPPAQVWYWCSSPAGYYPAVPACTQPWQAIAAGAPAVSTTSPPDALPPSAPPPPPGPPAPPNP